MLLKQVHTEQLRSEELACDFLEQNGFYVPLKGITIFDREDNTLGEIDAIAHYKGKDYVIEFKHLEKAKPTINVMYQRLASAVAQLKQITKWLRATDAYKIDGAIIVIGYTKEKKHYWHVSAYDLRVREVVFTLTGCRQTTTANCA